MGPRGPRAVRRKLIIQTHPREPEACYASHRFFRVLSPAGNVNGRAHATASPPVSSHTFPAITSAWARSRSDCAPMSIRGRGSASGMRALTRRAGGQAWRRRAATASVPSRPSMPAPARTPAMSAPVRASCFGRGSRGRGRGRGSGRAGSRGQPTGSATEGVG